MALEKKIYTYDEVLDSSLKYFGGDSIAAKSWVSKYALKGNTNDIYELNPKDMHLRIANEISRVENKYPNPLSTEKIFDLLDGFKYIIPQGGPMSGIGNNYQISSLSNCFVIGELGENGDSYGVILKIDQEQVQLMKRRGGVGHDLSLLRPTKSPTNNSALTSTGIIPFMERYSNSTREVAQDGRRGALMLSLSITHPDSEAFIDAKMIPDKITGANVSVRIDDEFMKAVKENRPYVLKFPIDSDNPKIVKTINAKDLWDKITYNAWKSAEPGVLFWDTIIRESIPDSYSRAGEQLINSLKKKYNGNLENILAEDKVVLEKAKNLFSYKTVSTNPCGEIPLCPYDSCRLLAINLYSYVDNPFTKEASFNFEKFKEHVHYAQRISDDIIDLELEKIELIQHKIDSDPEDFETKLTEIRLWEKIKKKAIEGRRMGLGVTAEADMLAALNLRYGSDEAIDFSTSLHKIMAIETYKSSVNLAKDRGAFGIYDAKIEENNPFINRLKEADNNLYEDMVKYGRRNISLLTIAPTGTTSLMTQTTSGLESVFLPVYKRRRKINHNDSHLNVAFVDSSGDSWEEYNVFHPKFCEWLKINGFDVNEVIKYSDDKINELLKKSPYYKSTSNDIDWIQKIKMQGSIQKWIDHSISVTVNLPEDVNQEFVGKVYETAWESGCKGVTVYREGSREGILLSNKKINNLEKSSLSTIRKRPKELEADVLRFKNIGKEGNLEDWIAFIGLYDGKPYEIFTGKVDDDVLAVPKSISKGKIVKETNGTSHYDFHFQTRRGYTAVVPGISDQFEKVYWNYARLLSHILQMGEDIEKVVTIVSKLEDVEGINSWKSGVIRALNKYIPNGTKSNDVCPVCKQNYIYQEGCRKCDCGSKCE